MPITVDGILSTEQMLLTIDTTAKKRIKAKLGGRAHAIAELARKMAPRDEGNLEQAIKVRGDETGVRDSLGRFARVEIEVYVDMDMPLPEREGKTVGDYAYEIHEHQTPYGSKYGLGPKSQEKQAGSSVTVGGGFLERAAEALDDSIDEALLDIVRDL